MKFYLTLIFLFDVLSATGQINLLIFKNKDLIIKTYFGIQTGVNFNNDHTLTKHLTVDLGKYLSGRNQTSAISETSIF
jgi:hypothetical protein